jgi:hypothetical protein
MDEHLPNANIQTSGASHDAVNSHSLTLSVVNTERIPWYIEEKKTSEHSPEAPMA